MNRLTLTLTLACGVTLAGCSSLNLDAVSSAFNGGDAAAAKPVSPTQMVQTMEQLRVALEAERKAMRASLLAEQRGPITATGYAVISVQEHNTPAQRRLMAIRASKLDAYRTLTEQVFGQQLDSTTTVADATLLSDTFRTRVQGIIHGARVVSITPVGDDTYETTLALEAEMVNELRRYYMEQTAKASADTELRILR